MGMFDYVKCDAPLLVTIPDGPEYDKPRWQTKDFDNAMGTYTITAEGRLFREVVEWERTPEDELPEKDAPEGSLLRMFGCVRAKSRTNVAMPDYHGDVFFYDHLGAEWYEFRARFTEGKLASIIRVFDSNAATEEAP